MKYMLLLYSPESSWTPDEWQQCLEVSTGICQELAACGELRGAAPLHPVATAATVRIREGRPLVSDGPFAETTEQLGGYYVIDVDDLDAALAIAARLPSARKGTVEIRPLTVMAGLPDDVARPSATDEALRRFLLLCYDDEAYWAASGAERLHAARQQAVALTQELAGAGRFVSASPLHPSPLATSLRIRDGKRQITDGPFAETREVLGGYYLILARDREEALATAARHPGAEVGAVEVREVVDVPALSAAPA